MDERRDPPDGPYLDPVQSPTPLRVPEHPEPDDAAWVRRWLGSLDEDALTTLVELRPDLAWGAPPLDLQDLADRLLHPASLARAVDGLDTPSTLVLSAVVMTGWDASGDRIEELTQPVSGPTPAHRRRLGAVLADLARRGLVVPRPRPALPDGLLAVPDLERVLPLPVAGLPLRSLLTDASVDDLARLLRRWGVPVDRPNRARVVPVVRACLSDRPMVMQLLARADVPVRQALARIASEAVDAHPPAFGAAVFDPALVRAENWARENGLSVGRPSPFGPVLSTEVVLALLDGSLTMTVPFDPPPLPTTTVSPEIAHRASSGGLTDALVAAMSVLELAARRPLTCRRDGTLGARELTRTARTLGLDVRLVRWALETGTRRGLLDGDGTTLTTTGRFEVWRRSAPAARAVDLLEAWLALPTLVVRDRDLDGGPAAALGPPTAAGVVELRRAVLRQLVELPPGTAVTSVAALLARAAWRDPQHGGPDAEDPTVAADVLTEAELLGVVAAGAVTTVGRALLTGPRGSAVAAAQPLLPAVGTTASFGSDLTVVVAGNPAADVVDLLDLLAERESRGAASSWRFTTTSVRSALDAGHLLDDLLAGLREVSVKPLPPAVDYFVTDVARRHGRVGVRPAGAVLVGEEPLVAELRTSSALRRLALQAVAPTVLVSPATREVVLEAVRRAGYLPVSQEDDGSPTAPPIRLRRNPTEVPDEAGFLDAAEVPDPEAPSPAAVALRLLAGREPAQDVPVEELTARLTPRTRGLSGSERRQLAHALVHGRPVSVVVSDGYGHHVVDLDAPRFSGTTLTGTGPHGRHREVALGKVTSVVATAPRS